MVLPAQRFPQALVLDSDLLELVPPPESTRRISRLQDHPGHLIKTAGQLAEFVSGGDFDLNLFLSRFDP